MQSILFRLATSDSVVFYVSCLLNDVELT